MSYQFTQTGSEIQAILNSVATKYQKPATGIPKTDLESTVQEVLDNAMQGNAPITGATKCKVTYDSKGLVTAGEDLSASDIPSLNASKITAGTFADARIASASTWNAKYTKPSSGIPDSDIASASTWNGKASLATYSASVSSTGWTEQSAGWFTKDVTVTGILATDNPIADIDLSSATSTNDIDSLLEDWSYIFRITTSADTITLYSSSEISQDITLTLQVTR